MKKRNGRSCGKVQVRLTRGACATIALNPLQRVVVSALFVFVEFNGGSAKATVMTCCRSFYFSIFSFCLLPCFPPHRPYYAFLCLMPVQYFLPLHRVVFVCETAVILFVLFCPCNRYKFLFSTYVVLLATFPFRSSCITFFRTPVGCFASFVWCVILFLFFFSFFSFYGLACFVVFSYPVC